MKLLIADDHILFRDALVHFIERSEEGAQISLAQDFDGALDVMGRDPEQDLVLLDLRMPGMNGMEGFKTMIERYPDVKLALMSGLAEEPDVRQALDIGAVGYFPKTLSGKAMLKAMHLVLAGEKFVPIDPDTNNVMPSYRVGREMLGFGNKNNPVSLDSLNLSPREKEVLSYLVNGLSNKEIANELDLQEVTIKLHVRGICKKLNAKNRTQAALKARELGVTARDVSHA